MAIIGFDCKETEKLWRTRISRKFPADIIQPAIRKLLLLHAAKTKDDLRYPPGNNLEMLKGDMKGLASIRINRQWRICFTWQGEHADNVHIIDYH